MDKFSIKPKSLSVGFNIMNGQYFFDTLSLYDKYIKEYFFSVSEGLCGEPYNSNLFIETLGKLDTYNIPANIIFNNMNSFDNYEKTINILKSLINVKSVTILHQEQAEKIRNKFPELEIHLSVRFFDRGKLSSNIAPIKSCKDIIDVINISPSFSYNDTKLIDIIHEYGIKVKILVNEGCIINKSDNYCMFDGFTESTCNINPFSSYPCQSVCIEVRKKYPWTQICTNYIYKENLKYINYDIIKISGRILNLKKVTNQLTYWTSSDKTQFLNLRDEGPIDISDKYNIFLEYIETRSKCKGFCNTCKRCKKFYNIFTGKN